MNLTRFVRLVGITAAAAALLVVVTYPSAAGGRSSLGRLAGMGRHGMATLTLDRASGDTADCVPPAVVSVVCHGLGVPMTWGGGAIQAGPSVYIVFWGWHGSDPSGQAAYQESFFNGIGGSAWNGSQTQYCSPGDVTGLRCAAGAAHVGNPGGILHGVWSDDTDPVPSQPDDAAIQAEAARAASHFGNTTAAANASVQYVVDTPHGNSTSGFGTQWCAYHGAVSSSFGVLSYTDFPYTTDAGAGCGENFVNSGPAGRLDGVSIVGGHEFAESETDPVPASGWTDTIGAETGDKCAWISLGPGASGDVTFSSGTFAVQSLWSNAANAGAGGCVL